MPFRKCELCGIHNYNTNVTIFDVSKRKLDDNSKFNYLCEKHFAEEDLKVSNTGVKRYIIYLSLGKGSLKKSLFSKQDGGRGTKHEYF